MRIRAYRHSDLPQVPALQASAGADLGARHRRQGIAAQVLQALLGRARDLGLRRVFLHTLLEQRAAQQLYLGSGFRDSGRGEIHGNAVIACEKTP